MPDPFACRCTFSLFVGVDNVMFIQFADVEEASWHILHVIMQQVPFHPVRCCPLPLCSCPSSCILQTLSVYDSIDWACGCVWREMSVLHRTQHGLTIQSTGMHRCMAAVACDHLVCAVDVQVELSGRTIRWPLSAQLPSHVDCWVHRGTMRLSCVSATEAQHGVVSMGPIR